MKLSNFQYDLPDELLALYPEKNRDESRLLVFHKKTGKIEHKVFKDIFHYFSEDDVMVFNDTRVFPARVFGTKEKTGAKIEVFLLRELNKDQFLWDVLVDPARKIRIGNKIFFGEGTLVAEVIDNTTSRGRTLRFLYDGEYDEFKKTIFSLGQTPLPKHIVKREVEEIDEERYQTIFARKEGAVAAPTAGLHFSRELLKRLEIVGVKFEYITLHVGLGNFRNVEVEDLTKHKADSEEVFISGKTADVVNEAKRQKKKVCAIGTTVLKTLETSVTTTGFLTPYEGWTNKFIFPPYEVQVPNAMVSNFHLPKTTLMMSVAAFTGYGELMKIYETAIKEKYRFGTYGDAMLAI